MPALQMSMAGVAYYYLTNPVSLARVFFSTIGSPQVLQSYWDTFIGILGLLDVPLDSYIYIAFGILILFLATISLGQSDRRVLGRATLPLLSAAILSIVILLLIELLTWTPFLGTLIWGVQGRYFTPTFILLGFALFGRRVSVVRARIGLCILFVELMLSAIGTVPKLLDRYWLT